jgi:hypothetical protein
MDAKKNLIDFSKNRSKSVQPALQKKLNEIEDNDDKKPITEKTKDDDEDTKDKKEK